MIWSWGSLTTLKDCSRVAAAVLLNKTAGGRVAGCRRTLGTISRSDCSSMFGELLASRILFATAVVLRTAFTCTEAMVIVSRCRKVACSDQLLSI